MKSTWVIVALPFILGGCLPLSVSIVSTAISGISYVASGKSTSDHVLSAAVEKDCALTRPIFGDPVCRDIGPNGEGATASVVVDYYPGDQDDWMQTKDRLTLDQGALDMETVDNGPAQLAIILPFLNTAPKVETSGVSVTSKAVRLSPTTRRLPVAFASDGWQPPSPSARIMIEPAQQSDISAKERGFRARDAQADPSVAESGRYVIIGSFRDKARADVLAGRHGAQAPKILVATVKGQDWYRVAMGPFTPDEAMRIKHDLGSVGGITPWMIRLSTPTLLAQL